MRLIKSCLLIGSCLAALANTANSTNSTALPVYQGGYANAKNETPKGTCGSDLSWVKFGSATSKNKLVGKVMCSTDKNVKLRYQLYPGDVHFMQGLESDKSGLVSKC